MGIISHPITMFFVLVTIVCFCDGVSAAQLHDENFDDQVIDPPSVGHITIYKDFSWIPISPPEYTLVEVGRGGSGYCFSGAQDTAAWGFWNYGQTWHTDEMYVSFWQRFDNFVPTDPNENLKIFYPHWDGTTSYVHFSLAGDDTTIFSAKSMGDMLSVDGPYLNCPDQTDGNWHHYEFWIKFSTSQLRFWYDDTLKRDDEWGAGIWTNSVYYTTLGSADAEEPGNFLRQYDDWEVWDEMPSQGPPSAPTNLSSTNGITWVNHIWDAGSGNITDSYNVSINNTWYNTSSNEYYNHTGLSAGTWSNITVYAFNNTDGISTGSVSQDVQTSQSDISLSTNQFTMCNAWNTPQTFTQIDTEVDNLVGMVWYNHTSGWWEAYMSGRSYNSNNAIPENCSVFMFVNAPTSVSTPSTVNEITIVSGDWFYGWLPGEVDKTLSEIETEMNTDGLDVWHISAFNGTARSYTSAGDYSISPRGGFRVHCNVTGAFTI